MALNIKINEKENLNEIGLLGVLAWGTVAVLIGKLLGFKFNLNSNDQMTQWGFQLGEAFKFSRQKLKNAGLPAIEQERINRILDGAEIQIKNLVQRESASVRRSPTHRITVDTQIEQICDSAVDRIQTIVKNRRVAEEYVIPLRNTFDNLHGALDNTRREAALNALMADPGLRRAIERSLMGRSGRPPNPALVDATIDAMARRIATSLA